MCTSEGIIPARFTFRSESSHTNVFFFSGADVAKKKEKQGVSLTLRCLHFWGLLMAHSDHPSNTYSSLSLFFFFGVKKMFYSTDHNGSQAVPDGYCGTTQHRHA